MSLDVITQSQPRSPSHASGNLKRDDATTSVYDPLFNLLSNSLILTSIASLLSLADRLALSATDHALRRLIYHTPGVFRHVDLSQVKALQWPDGKLDWDDVGESECYSQPIRRALVALDGKGVLGDIQTLILDGLPVPPSLAFELINSPKYNIRILSIRAIKNVNVWRLAHAVRYACRPSRPDGAPRLKCLYYFTEPDRPVKEVLGRPRAVHNLWWCHRGPMFDTSMTEEDLSLLLAAEGLIAMDAVLCRGPPHQAPGINAIPPSAAIVALGPCSGCHSAPEGLSTLSKPAVSLPLLTPIPNQSSTLRAATAPSARLSNDIDPSPSFVPRCYECLCHRYCRQCHRWWCESCFSIPGDAGHLVGFTDMGLGSTGPVVRDYSAAEVERYKPKVRGGRCVVCRPLRHE